MMSSVFPSAATANVGPSSNDGGGSVESSNSRFEDELYVAYLQARSRSIAVSSAGLLDWAQEIAVSEGYYDRDEAKTALSAEWLDGWCQRYNVDMEECDEEQADEEDQEDEEQEEDAVVESSSLVLYPPPIDSPLTPSPPPQQVRRQQGSKKSSNATSGDPVAPSNANDIESVVANYLSTPAPRSRLFEHMLAESASRVLIKFMNETLHLGDDVRPEHLPPDELNRVLIQFFRQIHRPGTDDEPYSVKVLHGILEGLSRYLRGCGYSCDLAYESNFSEARGAFGERLTKAFELESKQRLLAARGQQEGDVNNEEVTKKMVQDHRLRPLGSDEIAPDEAMASFNKNTQKVMTWAAKNVVGFGRERLGLSQFTRVEDMPPEVLNIVLTRFFCESRKADGTEFGWNSFKSVFSNLEAYLRVHRYPLGLHDPVFKMAKQTLFNVLRPGGGGGGGGSAPASTPAPGVTSGSSTRVASNGNNGTNPANSSNVGNNPSSDSAGVRPHLYHRPIEINSAEENILWSRGAFGWHSPQAINTTLYYYMRHIYGVRSGESHRRINFGDLRTMRTDDGREEFLVYTKAAAGVDMSRLRRMWATRDDRCIVRVYKVMVAKRPAETRKPDAPLYLQPKRQLHYTIGNALDSGSLPTADESNTDCWFTTAPLGKNALATLMREAYQSCGLDSSRFNSNNNQPGSFNGNNRQHLSSHNGNRRNDDDYGDDDMDNLLGDSNNSNMADDDPASSSRSSSSFSHHASSSTNNAPQATSLVLASGRQQQKNTPSSVANNNRRCYMSPAQQSTQNQAIDLASPNNRKRGGAPYNGNNNSSSLVSPSDHQQEALSLCTTGKNNGSRQLATPSVSSRLATNNNTNDYSLKAKLAKLSPELVKMEPNGSSKMRSATGFVQNDSSPDHRSDSPSSSALSASALGSGVGNMSISMQPKSAADMADVLGFLNQFLNSLNGNNNGSSPGVYKCSVNVTVNISK